MILLSHKATSSIFESGFIHTYIHTHTHTHTYTHTHTHRDTHTYTHTHTHTHTHTDVRTTYILDGPRRNSWGHLGGWGHTLTLWQVLGPNNQTSFYLWNKQEHDLSRSIKVIRGMVRWGEVRWCYFTMMPLTFWRKCVIIERERERSRDTKHSLTKSVVWYNFFLPH